MKISLIQSDIAWNDPEENIHRCSDLADQALRQGGELLVFPEMFTCGFSMPSGDLAVRSSRFGEEFLQRISHQHRVFTVGTLPEVELIDAPGASTTSKLYNTAYLYSPGSGEPQKYRKRHLFSYGLETEIYSAGDGYLNVDLGPLRCSIFICYDLRFGAQFWDLAGKSDLFIVMANWPKARRDHWLTLLKARAIENQSYVVGVNRVGSGGGLEYSGDSVMFGPEGDLIGGVSDDKAASVTLELEPDRVKQFRERFPALRDRR
jgi:predicted amidohydrolase